MIAEWKAAIEKTTKLIPILHYGSSKYDRVKRDEIKNDWP